MADDQKPALPTVSETVKQVAQESKVPLGVRIVLGFVASGASAFILTSASLKGVNFEALGVNSEGIKSFITSTCTTIFVAPECIPIGMATCILFIRKSWRYVADAFTKPLPPE